MKWMPRFRLSLILSLMTAFVVIMTPLSSCAPGPAEAPTIHSASVPDDGFKAPQSGSRKLAKPTQPKNKIVSYRKHEPVGV
ncbi:MAG: hypothetical protein Q8922_07420 [Bacteroidota bacterium]|nr:hypothetical protein [Bacteroidota bacterium]